MALTAILLKAKFHARNGFLNILVIENKEADFGSDVIIALIDD